ncbi:MAG TPA: hypothetical protein VHF45_00460 [Thermoleophilaceae bacterium]|nr:hypothetical protein [Thermoleophilaceae bacterium]
MDATTSNRLYAAAVICLVVAALGVVLGPVELGVLAIPALLLYLWGNQIDPRDDWRRDLWR